MSQSRGIISIITAIMVSILLLTVAMGLLLLANGGAQQASDDELSLRGLAAAEGGVEWAYAHLLANPTLASANCSGLSGVAGWSSVNGSNNPFSNGVTCALVNSIGNGAAGVLGPNDAGQLSLDASGSPNFRFIQVYWFNQQDNGFRYLSSIGSNYNVYNLANLPPANTPNLLPGLELTIVNWFVNGSGQVDRSSGPISVRNVQIFPNSTETWDPNNLDSYGNRPIKYLASCNAANPTTPPVLAGVTSGSFACWGFLHTHIFADNAGHSGGLTNNPDEWAMVYVRPLYPNSTYTPFHYFICMVDNSNNCLNTLPQGTSTIDVTARSGPVYRRIVAQAPTQQTNIPAGLNYVLFGDKDICKDFNIYQTSGLNFTGPCLAP